MIKCLVLLDLVAWADTELENAAIEGNQQSTTQPSVQF